MSAAAVRLFSEIPREQECIALKRLALSRRLDCLIEHNDAIEAAGIDAEFVREEIQRVLLAMAALDQLRECQP